MPTRLLLDGDDLPALMIQIREEMGPHARVVKAERIRTGGFAGFFAREHYELTVEIPDAPPQQPSRRRAAAGGIDALLASADAADADGTDVAEVEPAEPAGPPVSTASDSFAEILASVRAMVGQGETAGVPVAEVPTAAEAAQQAPPALPAGPGTGAAVPFAFPRLDRDEIAGTLLETRKPDESPAAGLPAAAPSPAAGPALPPAGIEVAEAAHPQGAAGGGDPTTEAGLTSAPPGIGSGMRSEAEHGRAGHPSGPPEATQAPTQAPTHDQDAPANAATVASLLELGVPVRLLDGFTTLTDPVPLSMLVRRFAKPPAVRLDPGATVVVVGPGPDALRTATQMAGRAGLDGREVLLAGEIDSVAGHGRRLMTVAAAARHRARRREDAPTVVALGVGTGPTATADAANLLAALEPEQAWAVVDARLRATELRRRVRALGAQWPIDALAVVGTQEAQAPGMVLDVGVPVGWVDGLPATALVWAALLSERLADDAAWD